jgi:hypothetical protein
MPRRYQHMPVDKPPKRLTSPLGSFHAAIVVRCPCRLLILWGRARRVGPSLQAPPRPKVWQNTHHFRCFVCYCKMSTVLKSRLGLHLPAHNPHMWNIACHLSVCTWMCRISCKKHKTSGAVWVIVCEPPTNIPIPHRRLWLTWVVDTSASTNHHSLTVHSTLSHRNAIVRYNTRTRENLGNSTTENLVRYSTLLYRRAIVRVLWRAMAENPGTVRLC